MPIAIASSRQALADTYKTLGSWISVHTGDPGTAGDNEASGGSPAYARKQTTWTSGTGGVVTGSQVAIDVPPGTYTFMGVWNAASGGTMVDKQPIGSNVFNGQSQLLLTPTFTQL
ncbi:phage tail fiber protein [Nocardia farcinica]|uniref:phage tail fiber protein n=1 Tax=Nocardia farcinica TaxID=37329 RepID=UPI0037AFEAD0